MLVGTPGALVTNKLLIPKLAYDSDAFAVAEALKQPDAAKRLQDMNVDPVGGTPGDMAQFVKRESEVWGNIIRTAGITSD